MNASFTHTRFAAALLLPAALVSAAPQAPQAPADDETYQGEAPERYAMVRALEGDVRIRKGDLDEVLSRGTPVAEGDVVESRGRGVLQLGDGTRIAFGGATRFTVAALFTDRKGEKQVLLRLDYGRLRVLLGGQSDARFRVDTPSVPPPASTRAPSQWRPSATRWCGSWFTRAGWTSPMTGTRPASPQASGSRSTAPRMAWTACAALIPTMATTSTAGVSGPW